MAARNKQRPRPAPKPQGESLSQELNAELEAMAEPPQATVPQVDAEVAALLAQQQREGPAPAPPRPRQPPDPETVGSVIANRLLQEDAAARKAMADRRRGVMPAAGADRPLVVRPRKRRDRTAVGKEFVKAGWVSRWVRDIDDLSDKPSDFRIEEFTDYGYEPVLDGDGKQIRNRLGLLMQAPPQQYAERVRDYTPEGAQNREAFSDAARAIVEAGNSQAGREVARVVGDGARQDTLIPTG